MDKISKILKSLMIIISLIYLALFFIGLIGNPLSRKNINPGPTVPLNMSDLNDDNFWEENYEGDYESINYYFYSSKMDRVSLVKKTDSQCKDIEIKFINGVTDCVNINTIKNPNIHPLKSFTSIDDNFHLFGTIAINKGDSGIDRFSNITTSVYRTTLFSILSLITFLFFGISFALSIGYYNNVLSGVSRLFISTFQCVPILLWMLITIIVVGYSKTLSPLQKISTYFLFFGLFSCPALSNLIIEKINQMKNEDFIVALKLLGLSNYKIIVNHMLKFYCLPIIICQMSYVMAHAFFLDLTLCYIEKSNESSSTLGWYLYQAFTTSSYSSDVNFLIIISFILTFTLFYWSDYFKQKI